jgi:cell division protein FtsB
MGANQNNGTLRTIAAALAVIFGILSFVVTNGWGVLDRVAYSKEDGARLEERIKALESKIDELAVEIRELRRELREERAGDK